jgi:hypothetical protein
MMAAHAGFHVISNPQGSVQLAAGICDPPNPAAKSVAEAMLPDTQSGSENPNWSLPAQIAAG